MGNGAAKQPSEAYAARGMRIVKRLRTKKISPAPSSIKRSGAGSGVALIGGGGGEKTLGIPKMFVVTVSIGTKRSESADTSV